MQTIIFKSNDTQSLTQLIELAQKLNIKMSSLSEQQMEDLGLYLAMKEGTHGDYVSRERVMSELDK